MLIDRKLSTAEKLRKIGNFEQAIIIYEEILSKFPLNKRAQLGKSSCIEYAPQMEVDFVISLFDKKLYNEAESEIQNLIVKYKNDENLYNIYGAILSRLQIFDKAKEKYQKALELNPKFPEALNNLAELMNQTKEFNKAKQLCEEAIRLNKDYAEAYNNLGNSFVNLGFYKEANTFYEKSLILNNPNKYGVLNNLGLVNAFLNNFKVSNKYLIQATNLIPKEIEAVNTLASILVYQDKEDYSNISEHLIKNLDFYDTKSKIFILTYLSILFYIEGEIEKSKNYNKYLINTLNEFLENRKIFEPKDLNFVKAYSSFLHSLNKMATQESLTNNLSNKNIIYHLGESHCLSFAHRTIQINSQKFRIKPLITVGAKAWHLTDKKHNKQKPFFISQLKKVPYDSKIFISIGEIDTRISEGIITFHLKSKKDLNEIIKETVYGYVSFIEKFLESKKIEKFYFSIHAPYQIRENKDYNSELELKRIEIIKTFNNYLEKYTKEFNSKFVDTFSFTCDDKGESNKKYMIDPTHLSPEALPIIEQSINNL
tara:strand:- start:236 stop:1855 length:1620 start_codon:yes stop_codon:yes gene_type:complete